MWRLEWNHRLVLVLHLGELLVRDVIYEFVHLAIMHLSMFEMADVGCWMILIDSLYSNWICLTFLQVWVYNGTRTFKGWWHSRLSTATLDALNVSPSTWKHCLDITAHLFLAGFLRINVFVAWNVHSSYAISSVRRSLADTIDGIYVVIRLRWLLVNLIQIGVLFIEFTHAYVIQW